MVEVMVVVMEDTVEVDTVEDTAVDVTVAEVDMAVWIGGIAIHGIVMTEEVTVAVTAEEATAIGDQEGMIGAVEIGGITKVGAVMADSAEDVWIGQTS